MKRLPSGWERLEIGMLDHARPWHRMRVGAHPAEGHRPRLVSHSIDPVCRARVSMCNYDTDRAVGSWYRRVLVQVDGEEAVVERLHPVVVQLEVPGHARRRRHVYDERLVWKEAPVAVVIGNGGIATRLVRDLLIEARERIRMFLKIARPLREQQRGSRRERARVAKTVVYLCGGQRRGVVRPVD